MLGKENRPQFTDKQFHRDFGSRLIDEVFLKLLKQDTWRDNEDMLAPFEAYYLNGNRQEKNRISYIVGKEVSSAQGRLDPFADPTGEKLVSALDQAVINTMHQIFAKKVETLEGEKGMFPLTIYLN